MAKFTFHTINKDPRKGPFLILLDGVAVGSGYPSRQAAIDAVFRCTIEHPRWFSTEHGKS